MEVELKYSIGSKDQADIIWVDEDIAKIGDEDSRETTYMKAVYFDTEDRILAKNDMAYRVRMEGSRIVASLKMNGNVNDGLHVREEINVPIDDDESCFIRPDPIIFKESEEGKELIKLVNNKNLLNILETNFIRRSIRVDTGNSIFEIAIDVGEIVTDNGNSPICEMEIELFNGEVEDILAFGRKIQDKYSLEINNHSKYARGKALILNN